MTGSRLQKAIIMAFHFLVLVVPFFFTWVNEELFEFPKMLLVYGFTIIVASLWTARMIVEKKLIVKATIFDWPLLFFLVTQTLSTIFSIHPHTSIFGYYTRFHGGLLSTLSYLLLFYALVSNFDRKQLSRLWLSIFVAGLGVSLYAIPEHFGYSPSCWLISGKLDVACWVQDVQNRIFATFGQPNWLAAFTITLLPLGIIKFVQSKPWSQKLLFGGSVLMLLVTLLFTKSRSGLVGLVGGLSVLMAGLGFIYWQNWQNNLNKKGETKKSNVNQRRTGAEIKQLALVIGGIGLIVLIIGSPFSPSLSQLYNTRTHNSSTSSLTSPTPENNENKPVNRLETGGTDSGEIRKIVWQGALKIWQRYPLFGSGVETFAYSYYQDRPLAHNDVSEWDFLYNKAHNEFLNYLSTTGLLGLGSYLLLLAWVSGVCLRAIWKPSKNADELRVAQQLLAILAGLIALSLSNFFGFSTVMVSVLMFILIAAVVILVPNHYQSQKKSTSAQSHLQKSTPTSSASHKSAQTQLRSQQAKNKKHLRLSQTTTLKPAQFLSLGVTAIIGLVGLNKVWQIWAADRAYALGKSYIQAGQTMAGLDQLQSAALTRPREALYHNQLGDTYSKVATLIAAQDSTASAEFARAAIQETQFALKLNPRHLNFYKAQARIFITLSALDASYLKQAQQTLETALQLAPTDAKLMYNLALVKISLGQVEAGIEDLLTTIQMRPNYEAARMELGKQYEAQNKTDAALEQYQYIYDHITHKNQTVNQKLEITTE
jgi:putative inorganic carbon (HCO3(-)) transporter